MTSYHSRSPPRSPCHIHRQREKPSVSSITQQLTTHTLLPNPSSAFPSICQSPISLLSRPLTPPMDVDEPVPGNSPSTSSPTSSTFLDSSLRSIRRQRQQAVRRQCSASHVDEIRALVALMVDRGDMCAVGRPAAQTLSDVDVEERNARMAGYDEGSARSGSSSEGERLERRPTLSKGGSACSLDARVKKPARRKVALKG